MDTLGHLLAVHITPVDEQERAQVADLAWRVQEVTEQSVTLADVDQAIRAKPPPKPPRKQAWL